VIVVVGVPAWQPAAEDPTQGRAAGPAADIARAAVASGSAVELVGKVGEDPEADRLLLDLARAGIGHVALLRDPGLPTLALSATPLDEAGEAMPDTEIGALLTLEVDPVAAAGPNGRSRPASPPAAGGLVLEPADLDLALRYLVEFRVLVVADDLAAPAVAVASEGAAFAEARVVAVASAASMRALPDDATVFERPAEDPDGEFARLVGSYAAALDRGEEPEAAFRSATTARGWETAG
jgi:ribokinase